MSERARQRIEIEALVLGYAMSRLDRDYLSRTGVTTWRAAYEAAANALSVSKASFKNLRDEFDPIHGNVRKGWHGRELRPNRLRVAAELSDASDEALIELVRRILARDGASTSEAIDALLPATRISANVAERLLTGRRAEEFFLENCLQLVGLPADRLIDCRISAKGFDFDSPADDERVFEVKGIKESRGDIQFTDREWSEARERKRSYWLIVVGMLRSIPRARVIEDPCGALSAKCMWRQSVAATWRSTVSIRG